MERTSIGRLLVKRGVARLADVERAAAAARRGDVRLCSKLLEMGACSEGDLVEALGEHHGMPGVDLSRSVIDLSAVALVPQAVAEAETVLPVSAAGGRLHLAVASPETASHVVGEVRFITGHEVSVYVVVHHALLAALAGCYDALARGKATWAGPQAPPGGPPSLAVRLPALPAQVPGASSAAAPPQPPPAPEDEVEDATDLIEREGEPVEVEVEAELVEEVELAVEEDDLLAAAVPAAAALPGARAAAPARGRVLVVDDEPAIRLLVQRALEHHGYAVELAADGLEALEQVRRARPDLVLLDAMLPGLHGFEVARRLRSDPASRALPVIMMSAVHRGWRFAQDARESFGVQDYVEKPFRVDDLLQRVEAALRGSGPGPAEAAAAPALARGRSALAAGRPPEAAAAFEEAVAADPFSAEAHHGLGEALRLMGETFRAMTAFERAIELKPRLLAAQRTLARLYLEKGFRAKAAEVLERAVHAAGDAATRETLRRELLPLL